MVERVVGQGTKREQISIEQRELTLPFERVRIARSIRIVPGSRFHLVACAETSRVARIAAMQRNSRHKISVAEKIRIVGKFLNILRFKLDGLRLHLEQQCHDHNRDGPGLVSECFLPTSKMIWPMIHTNAGAYHTLDLARAINPDAMPMTRPIANPAA